MRTKESRRIETAGPAWAMKGIKTGLICAASLLTVTGLISYLIIGAWHLLVLSIIAGTMGLTLKNEIEL